MVLTNVGEGAFAAPRRLQTSGSPTSPATADFDGDGLQDVASIIDFRSVQVFINSGDAFFEAGPLLDAGTSSGLRSLHAADIDLDGDIDLAVDSVRETCMLRNDGPPRFAASCLFLGECGVPRALGDFDGDGAPDLAVLCRGGPRILSNARGGRFEPPRRAGSFDQDHRFGSLVTGDFDLDGALDLAAAPSPTILWNRPMRLSLDCNGDGRPDECDALSGSAGGASGGAGCRDCNGNGIPDSTDMELGYQDADGNRVPDACEVRRFALVADGPRVVRAEPGDRVSIPAAVDLHSLDFEPGESGASGWLVYLKANNASIEDVTLEGTTAAARPEGFRNPSASFVNLGLIRKEDHCKGALRAAVALDLIEPTALDPAESPHTILRLTLGATVPLDGTGFSGLHFMSCDSCSDVDPAPTEGGGGCGGVDASYVGTPTDFPPTTTRDGIILLTPSAFRRGDSNVDGAVDISDPIRTLMFLFMGSTDLHCLDAADSNDDGSIDLTDAILIFDDFFRPGTGIPVPGPFACGHDPTPDGSGCDAYDPCGD